MSKRYEHNRRGSIESNYQISKTSQIKDRSFDYSDHLKKNDSIVTSGLRVDCPQFRPTFQKDLASDLRLKLSPEPNIESGGGLSYRKQSYNHNNFQKSRKSLIGAHDGQSRPRINSSDTKVFGQKKLQIRTSDESHQTQIMQGQLHRIRVSQVEEKTNSNISSNFLGNQANLNYNNHTDLSQEFDIHSAGCKINKASSQVIEESSHFS